MFPFYIRLLFLNLVQSWIEDPLWSQRSSKICMRKVDCQEACSQWKPSYIRETGHIKEIWLRYEHLFVSTIGLCWLNTSGKSLYIRRLIEKLDKTTNTTILRLLDQEIDIDHILKRLYRDPRMRNEDAHLIHIDATAAVWITFCI